MAVRETPSSMSTMEDGITRMIMEQNKKLIQDMQDMQDAQAREENQRDGQPQTKQEAAVDGATPL